MFLLLTMIAVLALAGCGDDDNPTNPGGDGNGGTGDTFDQTTAELQAQITVPQAVMLVESIDEIAMGVDTGKNGTYQWNQDNQRWEFHYQWDYQGYSYDWFLTVQYLDSNGTPVMHRANAASAHHTMEGTGSYTYTGEPVNFTWTFAYDWDVTIGGLHTQNYTMTGSGGYTGDYTAASGGGTINRHYVVSWETLDEGISLPAGGCPTGTIRYHFNPYVMDITFDGTSTASWVLKNQSGSTIRSGTESLDCGNS